jgi:MYXO-CTERM domain-containing protein
VGSLAHAALWSGSAASLVDLHPAGAFESEVWGMAPGEQAGWFEIPSGAHHAALWHGTAASVVDLNPTVQFGSELLADCGVAQVGWAGLPGGIVAGVWFGTAASFVPLPTIAGYDQPTADAVSVFNGMLYVGGYALNLQNGRNEAFLWTGPVPAPGAVALLALAASGGLRRRRRGPLRPALAGR